MITADEIKEKAGQVQLQPTVVEKDYALGWMLAGISQHLQLKDNWIFKGGTCLKKCYFETFRFSEDLDFTYSGPELTLTEDLLVNLLDEVGKWVYSQSGIEIPKEGISFDVFKNPRGTISAQGKISYRGPLRPNVRLEHWPRVKIDLTMDELLVEPTVFREVEHLYSDKPTSGIQVRAYSYEEVFAEKTRALVQRLRPRDLYDVIHLHRNKDMSPDPLKVKEILEKKCAHRSVGFPTYAIIETHDNRAALQSEWSNQLKHQLPVLPPFEEFLKSLPDVLNWIAGVENVNELEQANIGTNGQEFETESISIQELVLPGLETSYLDKVRFAASNRLLINLGYGGERRLIEPYSLARSTDGNLLLYAIKHQTGETRGYRWDRIESMEVVSEPFTPRYKVEITSSGYLPIKQLTRAAVTRSSRQPSYSNGPTYVYKCGTCGKQFKRKSNDSSLKPHKSARGNYTCNGSYGIFVKTEY